MVVIVLEVRVTKVTRGVVYVACSGSDFTVASDGTSDVTTVTVASGGTSDVVTVGSVGVGARVAFYTASVIVFYNIAAVVQF